MYPEYQTIKVEYSQVIKVNFDPGQMILQALWE